MVTVRITVNLRLLFDTQKIGVSNTGQSTSFLPFLNYDVDFTVDFFHHEPANRPFQHWLLPLENGFLYTVDGLAYQRQISDAMAR